jgi:hypothetical protein
MHRFRSRLRGAVALGLRWRRLTVLAAIAMSCTTVGLLTATTAEAPSSPDTIHTCKPLPPYDLQMQPAGNGQWTLSVHNSAATRQVVVWMWSETDPTAGTVDRQRVWSGVLQEEELRTISVSFVPSSEAVRVWASVETEEARLTADSPAERGMAVAPGPAAPSRPGKKTHIVLEEPSGRRVDQYVGQGGLQ